MRESGWVSIFVLIFWARYEARQAKTDAAAEKKRALKATLSMESRMSQDEMFGPSISLSAEEK